MTAEPADRADDGNRARGPVLHHVNLKTTRKDEMVAWYREVLGMETLYENPGMAFLTNDDANHRLAFFALPGLAPDEERRFHDGLHHLAFDFDTFEALHSTYLRLRDAGLEPTFSCDHGITVSLYYEDPDGNLLELQTDAVGSWTESRSWLELELPRAEYPAGSLLDARAVSDAYVRGMSFGEIHERAYRGEFRPDTVPDLSFPPLPDALPPIVRT